MDTVNLNVEDVVKKFDLINLTPQINIRDKIVNKAEITRPSLFLAGYFKDFSYQRIQLIGGAEYNYANTLSIDEYKFRVDKMLEYDIPAIIFCSNTKPKEEFLELANKHNVPVLGTEYKTSTFAAELNRWLIQQLAPRKAIHGVLVEVYGIGVLLTGESGIGKSEAALELIRRGHRLISDDIVEVHKVNGDLLVGESPNVTKHFLEVRGIGIIDIKTLYGVESVKNTKTIDLVVNLEEWDSTKKYDRTGMKPQYTNILGIDVVEHIVPIKPGRNIAVIVESAAVNFRQRKMGIDAATDLYNRMDTYLDDK